MQISSPSFIIGAVGPCGSGKTTLVNGLLPYGVTIRHIAQEHSYVPDMWQRITKPDLLIFLDASYPETVKRRNLDWSPDEYNEQQRRLAHAREHCNLYIFTDGVVIEEVLNAVINFLRDNGVPLSKP